MDSLRFSCRRGCTRCCEQKGFVYLTEDDLRRAAALLGIPARRFEAQYVYRTRRRLRFRKPRHAECPFLRPEGCVIHPAKPAQCRLFPFWPELVEDREAWVRTAQWCPGIGTGRLYRIGTAVEKADRMRRAYPEMYD